MKTKEELMLPRFKVIALYPFCSCKVGDIYIENSDEKSPKYTKESGGFLNFANLSDYPHLFKKLDWWEERKVEDMPHFLRTHTDKVVKCLNWRKEYGDWKFDWWSSHTNSEGKKSRMKITGMSVTSRIATEEEYLNQKSAKKNEENSAKQNELS